MRLMQSYKKSQHLVLVTTTVGIKTLGCVSVHFWRRLYSWRWNVKCSAEDLFHARPRLIFEIIQRYRLFCCLFFIALRGRQDRRRWGRCRRQPEALRLFRPKPWRSQWRATCHPGWPRLRSGRKGCPARTRSLRLGRKTRAWRRTCPSWGRRRPGQGTRSPPRPKSSPT